MALIEYYLFRVKFIPPSQGSLFDDERSPAELFVKALQERPSATFRSEHVWHIGNLQQYTDFTGYFAVGRTTRRNIATFDEETRNFIEEASEESPYTHAVYNARIGFLAIAKKSNLSPTATGVAEKVRKLLGVTSIVTKNDIEVRIDPIADPSDFIKRIQAAYAVISFGATFTGPNPFDADEYFQKPLSVYLNAANGQSGKAVISGQDLSRDVVEQVSRSTAATGNEADAKIQESPEGKPLKIHMAGDALRLVYEEEQHDPEQVLVDFNEKYQKLREP